MRQGSDSSRSWRRGRARWLVAAFAMMVVPLVTPTAAFAHHTGNSLEIESKKSVAKFAGQVERFGPTGPQNVEICAQAHCQHWVLDVQATITWTGKFNDIVNLEVVHNGRHTTDTFMSTAAVTSFQSVRLNTPGTNEHSTPNGRYDIYVGYGGYVDSANQAEPSPAIKFSGWVDVQFETKAKPVRDLLPDVIALPPLSVSFDTPPSIDVGNTGKVDSAPPGSSCFYSELAQGAHVCLRIDQRDEVLPGPDRGPVEIVWSAPVGVNQDEPAYQVIHRSDGTTWMRPAGFVKWHDDHGHWHYDPFSSSDLYQMDARGNRASNTPVARGQKQGFCQADTERIAPPGTPFVAPLVHKAPDCLFPQHPPVNGMREFSTGTGPGNGDTYQKELPGQYIDARDLDDGIWRMETVFDPAHNLLEANPHNNCVAVAVQTWDMKTSHPHARLLGLLPPCNS
jgi:hypothetical protein